MRRVLYFYYSGTFFYWIESIGDIFAPNTPYPLIGDDISLVSCIQNDKLLFSYQDFLKVLRIPKVVAGKESVTKKSRYSLDGRCLNGPQKGVNIVKMSNGEIRKVLVK